MDNVKVGSFIAGRRTELGMTQTELAEKLHVTNKAISKWETGKGFPDVSLLEPLAEALQVSVTELMRGELQEQPLDPKTTDETVVEAMAGEKRRGSRRLLKGLKWTSFGLFILSVLSLLPDLLISLIFTHTMKESASIGVIGGADGPTAILVTTTVADIWRILGYAAPIVLIGLFILFAVLEKRKK